MFLWSRLVSAWKMTLISADPQAAMEQIRQRGIQLTDIEQTDQLTWQFTVNAKDGRTVNQIAESKGYQCEILERYGLFRQIASFKKRPVLIIGLLLLAILSAWIPTRVLFIEIQGNKELSTYAILEEAKACGVATGASRRYVRSQIVKNKLLDKLPQLQWAGVETFGCVAVITVRERVQEQEKSPSEGICSIVANRDGIVYSMTVLKGNGICKPGQAVKKGQVLISGYTDCGICIRAEHADGEVFGLTQHEISAVFPKKWTVREDSARTETKVSLIIGKKQINFYKDSGISDMSCAKIYKQKYMTLPGGFQLPICLLTEQRMYYDNTHISDMDGTQCLQGFARQYILSHTQAGKIQYMQELLREENACLKLDGCYGCIENIGQVKMEEEIPNYGKND